MVYKNGHKWISDDHFVVWCMKLRCINTFFCCIIVVSFYITHFIQSFTGDSWMFEALRSRVVVFLLLCLLVVGCCNRKRRLVFCCECCVQRISACHVVSMNVWVLMHSMCVYIHFRTLYLWLSRGLLTVHFDDDV